MGLQVGSLYASLGAEMSGWSKAFTSALKDAENFARQMKRVSSEIAAAGAAMSALAGGAIALAATVDGPTKAAVDDLKKSTQLLAVQVADMLLPAVKALTEMFRQAAGVVAGLSPHTKEMISTFAVIAVQVAAAAKAFSVLSGLAGNAIGIVRAVVLAAGPIVAIAATLALVAGAVLLVHRAWRKNWGGIQEVTKDVLEWFRGAFAKFADFMGSVWDFLVDGAKGFVDGLLAVGDVIQRVTGRDLGIEGMREGFAGLWKDLKSGSFFSQAFEFGKTVGQDLVDGIKEEWQALKKELGLGDLFKEGTPIGLGRGGPRGTTETSSLGTMSFLGALTANANDAADAAAQLARSLSEAAGAETKYTDRGLHGGDQGSSHDHGTVVKGAARAAQAMSEAVNAPSWEKAKETLAAGSDEAISAGQTLALWGQRMSGLMANAGRQILGAVGELAASIVEGAKQGGVWGAVMAGFMEIAKQTQSAMQFLGIAMEFVKQLAAMVEPLVKPIFDALTNVLGIVLQVVEPVFAALKPAFEAIAGFVKQLSPILYAVGDVLQGIAPIIEVIGKVLGVVFQALQPVIDIIAGILKVVATTLLGFIIMLNEIAAGLGDEAARAESIRLKGIVDKMWAPGANELAVAEGEAAGAALRNAAAQDEAAQSAQRVSESLSNVPSGYRLALARYNADMGISSSNMGWMGSSKGAGGVVINGDVNVTSDASTIEELAEDARKEAARERGQQRGNPVGRGGRGRDD